MLMVQREGVGLEDSGVTIGPADPALQGGGRRFWGAPKFHLSDGRREKSSEV